MKKIFRQILGILRGFFINPFWKSLQIVIVIALSLAINGFLWYTYATKIKVNPIPFVYSSGLLILNLFLGNFLWNREKLASILLLYTGFFVQILMLLFLKYLMVVF